MKQNTDGAREATTTRHFTEVRNRVVPHQKAVSYATHKWLAKLHQHITDFAERPSDGRHRAKMKFPIADLGTVETSFVDSFETTASLATDPATVTIRYKCRGTTNLNSVPQSKEAYFALRELLNKHGLEHKSAISSTIAKIQLHPVVPVEMCFSVARKETGVHANFKNADGLGETSYRLSPQAADTNLLNAVEALILGDASTFMTKINDPIGREERIQLSKRLAVPAREEEPKATDPESTPSLFDKLKRAFGSS